jgi:hypothetical protein
MGGIKFEKPVKVEIPEIVTTPIEIPKLDLHLNVEGEGGKGMAGPIPEEPTLSITPDLGQMPAVRYAEELGLIRVSAGDIPVFLQKYQGGLAISQQNLEGWSESVSVFVSPAKAVDGAKKGLLAFLGADLLAKIFFGGFLTGSFAWGALAYCMAIGAYLGWAVSKGKPPPPPEARLLPPGSGTEK